MKSLLKYIAITLSIFIVSSCESQWEDHIAANNLRGKTLMQAIAENPQTTLFASILKKTGYDNLLSGDKMLTVFAPVNEALATVDTSDLEGLKTMVKNHVAYSNYTVVEEHFTSSRIEMINSKNLTVSGMTVNGIGLVAEVGKYNLSAGNGILHLINGVIPSKKNIWEYMQTLSGNLQAEFIKKQDKLIMDMEKSIQTGVDTKTGKPLYDTVWVNKNPFLNAYPINDESKNYTYALLSNEVVQRIESKYAKYFAKQDIVKQDSIVRAELIKDCILVPVEITADGRYISIDGVLMNISAANIQDNYIASNGVVYKLSDADVKIYENKVKTIKIEAENYYSLYASNMNAWMTRFRPSLSGGKDVVLNCVTPFSTPYTFINPDTTIITTISKQFYPASSTNNVNTTNNSYIEFRPVINSVAYKLYWSAYDDYTSHINLPVSLSFLIRNKTVTTSTTVSCKFSQKMLISFPDKPRLSRLASDGSILNNFSPFSAFASTRITAGVQDEKQLYRCLISEDISLSPFAMLSLNALFTNEDNYFNYVTAKDGFGDKQTIISPTYGEATVFVANTTENQKTSAGMIFLDYIKLVPVVDPNE